MAKIPLPATMEVEVEEARFLGRRRKVHMLAQYVVQPTRPSPRRTDYKERRHLPRRINSELVRVYGYSSLRLSRQFCLALPVPAPNALLA